MKIWNIAKITLFFAVVVIVCRFVLLPFVFPRKYGIMQERISECGKRLI